MGRRIRCVALVGLLAVLAGACTVPSTNPDGSVPQNAPLALNGMIEEPGAPGGIVWAADLFGSQLLRFDPATGVVAERFPAPCGTDDVVVAPDSSLVATCPTEGLVIRMQRDGTSEVLAAPGRGVNPIALEPSGDAVVVGFGTDEDDRLLRIPLDGTPVQVLAVGLPPLNGFGFGPDGLIYAPTGGVGGAFGTGGLARIDPATGELEDIALSFEDPARTGFDFAVGADVGPDGRVYVAQGFNAAVYAVDPATGAAELVGTSPLTIADNVLALDDGRVVLSAFFGGGYTVFTPDGAGGWTTSLGQVGT